MKIAIIEDEKLLSATMSKKLKSKGFIVKIFDDIESFNKFNNKNFDTKYFLQSNHEYKAIAILKNETLMNQIISLQPDRLEIINDKGLFDELPEDGKYMLYYAKQEKLKTIDQLNLIHSTLSSFIEILKNNYSIH